MNYNETDLREKVMDEIKPIQAPSETLAKFDKKVNTFIINVATLIKIALSNYPAGEDLKYAALTGDLRRYLMELADGINQYVKNKGVTSPMAVVVYYNDYSHVSDTFKRQLASLDKVAEIVSYIKKDGRIFMSILEDMDGIFEHQGNGELITIVPVINDPRVRNASDIFTKFSIPAIVKGLIKVCFISNFPIDYHINYEFYVLSTFTGDMWDQISISEKLFDDPRIPFTEETHVLFGDATLIKPLLHHKSKSAVLDKLNAMPKYMVNKSTIIKAMNEHDPLLNKEMLRRRSAFI